MKYTKEFKSHFSTFPIFSMSDARLFLTHMGASKGYASLFVRNMIAGGALYMITKGHYSIHEDVRVAGFAFAPFYYGLGDALTIHKIWDQQANPTIITVRKTRVGVRKVLDRNVVVRRLARGMFFGYDVINYSGFNVPVSDLEKTLLDMIYFHYEVDRDTFYQLFKRIDNRKFMRYVGLAKPHLSKSILSNWIIKEIEREIKNKGREKIVKGNKYGLTGTPRKIIRGD